MYLCDITNIQISRFNTFIKSFKKLDFPSVSCLTYLAKCFVPDCSMCLHDQAQQVLVGLHKCISSSPTTAIVKLSFKTGSKLYVALALTIFVKHRVSIWSPWTHLPMVTDLQLYQLLCVHIFQSTAFVENIKLSSSKKSMFEYIAYRILLYFRIIIRRIKSLKSRLYFRHDPKYGTCCVWEHFRGGENIIFINPNISLYLPHTVW